MRPKIYITKKIPKEVEAYLALYCDYKKWESAEPMPRDMLLREVSDIDGLLTHGYRIDEELVAHAPKLKVVSNMSVGYNNFQIGILKERGILATNTPGVVDETVADLVFALILAAGRRIAELDRFVKDGRWDKLVGEEYYGLDVHHTTLGIIGMGGIGRAVARRARFGFGMDILYHNRRPDPAAEQELSAVYCSMDNLLKESDYIVLMTPLTGETVNLIGQREFSLMKNSAIFVNASRGETVDEEALVNALEKKKIKGAALDVYKTEPLDAKNPLLRLSNIITVPHIGSAVQRTRDEMAKLAAENLVAALYGKIPPNLIKELKE